MIENLLIRRCTQTAVYWGNPTPDGYGQNTFDAPVEVSCRWEQRERIIKDRLGREVVSKATVWVVSDLVSEGWLYLGSLDDLDSNPLPMEVDGAYEIIAKDKIPGIKAVGFLRKIYL